MNATRCYVNGVEIDKLEPPLPFLKDDDWFEKFTEWAFGRFPTITIWVILARDDEASPVTDVWVGELPEWRRRQVDEGLIRVATRNMN